MWAYSEIRLKRGGRGRQIRGVFMGMGVIANMGKTINALIFAQTKVKLRYDIVKISHIFANFPPPPFLPVFLFSSPLFFK